MITFDDSILRQYSNSTALISMIKKFERAVNIENMTNDFYDKVFNIDTCKSYGLYVWGKIVGVSRYLKVEVDEAFLGFIEAKSPAIQNYPNTLNNSPLYAGQDFEKKTRLSDEFYRKLIKCKMLKNISDTSSLTVNKVLTLLFGDKGKVFCVDNLDMTMDIVFLYTPDPIDISIIKYADIIPRTSGVKMNIYIYAPPFIGFSEGFYPLNEGVVYREGN